MGLHIQVLDYKRGKREQRKGMCLPDTQSSSLCHLHNPSRHGKKVENSGRLTEEKERFTENPQGRVGRKRKGVDTTGHRVLNCGLQSWRRIYNCMQGTVVQTIVNSQEFVKT